MSITAEAIKSARDRLKESQEQFGARFGVDQGTISRWEKEGPPERGTAGKAIELVLSELESSMQ